MSINHYQYVCDSTSNSLIDQECVDITDAEAITIKCLDYFIVYKQSSQILSIVSCIDSDAKYIYKANNKIIDFTLTQIDNYYYIVTLENNIVKFNKIDHECKFTLISDSTIDGLKNSQLYGLNELGVILIDQTQIYLIQLQNKVIKQDIKQNGKQVILSKNFKYLFILTKESKLIVLNPKTLQLINEHNLKYTESEPLFFQLFEIHDTISLFSITAQKRIIYWTFQKEDLHTSSLVPTQSVKFKFKQKQIDLIDFQIDSTQNFLFIPFQSDSTIELYVAQLNHNPDQSIIKHIKKFVKESSKSTFFLQFIIPQDYMEKFMHGSNKCQSESEYLDFQKCFKNNQEQQIEFTDQEFPYILAMTSEKQDKIQFCWFYSDLVLTAVLPENQLVLYDSNKSKKKGSSIIQQSQLIHPPFIKEEEVQEKPKEEESVQQQVDPLVKVDQIISNDLLPKIQQAQQQLQVISNDVKNELVEDVEFIFLIKDLIETQVRKEIDKSGQNDQQALSKLEQQFKQDIQQMETQVESVIAQNLELYTQTCENFIMDNFNQQYFEQLIDDKIEGFLKQQANQQLSDCATIVQTATKEYLNTQIGPMYQVELGKMSKGVIQIFDKIVQYFSETQFIEQTKVNNFNQFIENTAQQIQALNKVVTQLIENNKPNSETLNKLDQLIQQSESQQNNRQQIPHDERLEKIENHILKLRNDFSMLTQNQQIQQMPGMDQFIKGMAAQLTQMQIKLTTPQLGMQQIQEVLNQLILQFQFFLLKFGS